MEEKEESFSKIEDINQMEKEEVVVFEDDCEEKNTDQDEQIGNDDDQEYEFKIQSANVPDELKSKIAFKSDSPEFSEARNKLKDYSKKVLSTILMV